MAVQEAGVSGVRSILFLTYHFPPQIGGIQTRIFHYLKTLSSRKVRTTVFVVGRESRYVIDLDPRLVRLIPCRGEVRYLLGTSLLLLQEIRSSGADTVHVLTGSSTLLGLLAVTAGRICRVRTAISLFGREDAKLTSGRQRLIFLLAATFSNSISTNSEATKEFLPERFRKKTRILLGGAEAMAPAPVSKRVANVLFVGRLVKRKGVDDLLRAFVTVHAKANGANLVLVGEGPERVNLTRLAVDLGITKSVEFKGHLEGAALQREYERSAMCILPSKNVPDDPATEGLGLSLIEASMHAKPLIGTNHGGIPEIIKDGVNGIIVPENSPGSLADAILAILSQEEMAMAMGKNALKIAQTRFTWDEATERLLLSYVS